jgi:muramoyltetrapeptide carboxypeptidase
VDGARLDRGLAELESLGFRVRLGAGARGRHLFMAGTRAERQRDLAALLGDPEVRAVIGARGGAGSSWLLRGLDAEAFRARPKLLVGYSDLTFLHLWLARQGVASLHGPMLAWELADGRYDREGFLGSLSGERGAWTAEGDDEIWPLRDGEAEGRLVGGCLSILAAASGTPWALRTEGEPAILFAEDADEPPYRVHRMLWQLRETGALAGVRGVVFGDMKGCAAGAEAGYTLEDAVRDALDGLDLAVAMGLSSGHTASPFVSLPLGVRARLVCGTGARLDVLEAPVS